MVAYFDTSYLAKLYFPEPNSDHAQILLDSADRSVTSLITYAEMGSALARRRREGNINEARHHSLINEFRKDWMVFTRISVTETLVEHAAELAGLYSLKGADAIHLASALHFAKAGRGFEVIFATADEKLRKGAVKEGLAIPAEYGYEGGKPGTVGEKKRKWGKKKK